MEVITYTSLIQLNKKAKELSKGVLETTLCHSFRVFVDKKCTEFHVFPKKSKMSGILEGM